MNKELREAVYSDHAVANVWPNTGLYGYIGSLAHGTNDDETDDIDILGAFIAPKTHYLGLTKLDHVNRVCVSGKYDFCLYELSKLIKLLLNGNPNVLSILFLPENGYIQKTWWGEALIKNRDIFLSKKLYKSYGGYAYGQLKKMTHSCTTHAFKGSKRRDRFMEFGYDCKNASHTIRLLRMGIEVLSTGEVLVQRQDAAELKDIKRGRWTLGRVQEEVERLRKLMDEAFIRSELPAAPDYVKAEKLLVSILSTELEHVE